MDVQSLSNVDIISTLPQDLIERILSLLPTRDALQTSILSRNWRYCWTSIPVLAFDDGKEIIKQKNANAIFQVLLLHTSPLVEFTMSIEVEIVSEIDQLILYLSRSKSTLKRFSLYDRSATPYKLPSSFFSLQGLESINLRNGDIDPPLTFNGFNRLKYLYLYDVEITAKMLKHFLTNCPLLETFYLIGEQEDFTRGNKFTFVELLECLPSIVFLVISKYYLKCFASGGMPQKLPTPLVHLRYLYLGVCFMEDDDLSSTFCMINSSPNLKKIYLRFTIEEDHVGLVDLRDYVDLKLDHLEELEVVAFNNFTAEMEFVKLVLAKSPVLKTVRIELNADISDNGGLTTCSDLPFLKASPFVKIIIEWPNSSS